MKHLDTLSSSLTAAAAFSFLLGFVGNVVMDVSLSRAVFASAWLSATVLVALLLRPFTSHGRGDDVDS